MNHYPQQVQDYVKNFSDSIEEEFGEDLRRDLFENHVSQAILKKFLSGEEMELNSEELDQVLNLATAETILLGLKEKGVVDSVENEFGEDIFFLTSKGKEVREYMKTLDRESYENFDSTSL